MNLIWNFFLDHDFAHTELVGDHLDYNFIVEFYTIGYYLVVLIAICLNFIKIEYIIIIYLVVF